MKHHLVSTHSGTVVCTKFLPNSKEKCQYAMKEAEKAKLAKHALIHSMGRTGESSEEVLVPSVRVKLA